MKKKILIYKVRDNTFATKEIEWKSENFLKDCLIKTCKLIKQINIRFNIDKFCRGSIDK